VQVRPLAIELHLALVRCVEIDSENVGEVQRPNEDVCELILDLVSALLLAVRLQQLTYLTVEQRDVVTEGTLQITEAVTPR
jgi:hypothetical protein